MSKSVLRLQASVLVTSGLNAVTFANLAYLKWYAMRMILRRQCASQLSIGRHSIVSPHLVMVCWQFPLGAPHSCGLGLLTRDDSEVVVRQINNQVDDN